MQSFARPQPWRSRSHVRSGRIEALPLGKLHPDQAIMNTTGSRLGLNTIKQKALAGTRAFRESTRFYAAQGVPVAYWWRAKRNFGDEMNPLLIRYITGRMPVHAHDIIGGYSGDTIVAIGSVLQHVSVGRPVVWGAGFIREGSAFRCTPKAIAAVRGPLTRSAVLSLGLPCPAVYGDPALLLPRYFKPTITGEFAIGIVPHLADKTAPELLRLAASPGVHIIDVQRHPEEVVREICRCSVIVSSSLHGVIVALSYGIPVVWVEFTRNVAGHGFKFRDFFESIRAPIDVPIVINGFTTVVELVDSARAWEIDLDLDALAAAFPF